MLVVDLAPVRRPDRIHVVVFPADQQRSASVLDPHEPERAGVEPALAVGKPSPVRRPGQATRGGAVHPERNAPNDALSAQDDDALVSEVREHRVVSRPGSLPPAVAHRRRRSPGQHTARLSYEIHQRVALGVEHRRGDERSPGIVRKRHELIRLLHLTELDPRSALRVERIDVGEAPWLVRRVDDS